MEVAEYSPLEIKISVVGYGRAEKRQVQAMVHSLLGLAAGDVESEDACDALAVAICHATHEATRRKLAVGRYEVAAGIAAGKLGLGGRRAAAVLFQVFSGKRPGLFAGRRWTRTETSSTGKAPDDDQPLKFRLTEAETREVFGLAGEAGLLQAPAGIAGQGGLHGGEDLPLRGRRQDERDQVQLLGRSGGAPCCWTGSSAWWNRPRGASSSSAPPSTITWG